MLRAETRLAWIIVSGPSATVCPFFAVPQPPDAHGSTDDGAGAGAGLSLTTTTLHSKLLPDLADSPKDIILTHTDQDTSEGTTGPPEEDIFVAVSSLEPLMRGKGVVTDARGDVMKKKLKALIKQALSRAATSLTCERAINTTLLSVHACRRFTCSCGACMRFDWDQCETRELIGVWDAKKKKYCNDWVRRSIKQLSGRGVSTHRSSAKAARAAEVQDMVKDVTEDTFIAINCGRNTQGFCYWLGKAVKAPYKAVDDWADHSGTKIKKGDFLRHRPHILGPPFDR